MSDISEKFDQFFCCNHWMMWRPNTSYIFCVYCQQTRTIQVADPEGDEAKLQAELGEIKGMLTGMEEQLQDFLHKEMEARTAAPFFQLLCADPQFKEDLKKVLSVAIVERFSLRPEVAEHSLELLARVLKDDLIQNVLKDLYTRADAKG